MDNQIERLSGAQRIRRRPAVVFGSDGSDGVTAALEMLLSIMSSECRHGYASEMVFTHYADGSMEIQDNGRGLYLGNGKPEEDHIWKSKLCDFSCGPAYPEQIDRTHEYSYFEETEKIPCGKYESASYSDWDLYAVQCVCAFMDVTVCRNGLELCAHFEQGENIGGISVKASDAPSGTKIRFRPDTSVFTCVNIRETYIPEQLQMLALLTPNCKFRYRKERASGMEEKSFCFPKGMEGYLEDRCAQALSSPVYTAQIAATGKDRYNRPQYGAKIQIALCFIKDGGEQQIFHNRRVLSLGGTHVERLLESITDRLHWLLDREIPRTVLCRHLCLIVHTTTTAHASHWVNGARTGICNAMIADMAQDCVKDDFSHYIQTHQDAILEIFGRNM